MIRTVVGRCVTHFGASVTLCEDAAEGMQAIAQVRPHAVLLDLIMPAQDGFSLLRRIKAFEEIHHWRTGVVVITGVRDLGLEQELEQSGANYLPKPFTPRDLLKAIQQVVQSFPLSEKRFVSMQNAI
jgi:CheY-like chemotaxis protein